MTAFAIAIMGVSSIGIVLLFIIKHWEEKHDRVFAPAIRNMADEKALRLKHMLEESRTEFRKLGPTSIRISRTILHDLALALAALSRSSERQAHRLADMVSHKHRFERRESTNSFLKQVSEYKNGSKDESNPLDTAE